MNKKINKRRIVLCSILIFLQIVVMFIFVYRNLNKNTNIDGQYTAVQELSVASQETVLDNTSYRFAREYNEIPVYSRNLVVSADGSDNAISMTGNFRRINETTTKPSKSSDELIEDTTQNSSEELYADILDMFYNNIQSGWAEYKEMSSLYGDEFCYLFPMSFSDPSYIDKIGYSFIDLNGDGTEELLIGIDTEEQQYGEMYQNVIYDLYTYMDNRIIHLATSGERFTYQLCEDNTIYYYGSGGAASAWYYHYRLDPNEPVLLVLESVHSDPDDIWENVYWYHATSGIYHPETYSYEGEEFTNISEAEADSIRDSWPKRIDFPLTYFSKYKPQNSYNTASENQTSNVLTQDQLNTIKQNLRIPDTLDVKVIQSEMTYWDAGQCWVVTVNFSTNDNILASATVNAETGEMLKDILMYSN